MSLFNWYEEVKTSVLKEVQPLISQAKADVEQEIKDFKEVDLQPLIEAEVLKYQQKLVDHIDAYILGRHQLLLEEINKTLKPKRNGTKK